MRSRGWYYYTCDSHGPNTLVNLTRNHVRVGFKTTVYATQCLVQMCHIQAIQVFNASGKMVGRVSFQGLYRATVRDVITHSMPIDTYTSIASSPGLLRGRGREGLVSTVCAWAAIIQILNNPNVYGYCLVYLPFDFNSSC